MHHRALFLFFTLILMLAGCGGGSETTNAGGAAGTAGAAGTGGSGGTGGSSAANQFAFDTDSYALQPGDERNYMCFTTHAPADHDLVITEVEPIYGKGIHHLAIYRPIVAEPEGTFNCPELSKDTWLPVYGGGVESGKLTMPPGAAMIVPKGAQILVQLHLLNATSDAIQDKAHIIFHTTTDTPKAMAGMYGIDNRDLLIPAQANNVEQIQTCGPVGHDMDVFAVFGHMHQRGKKIEVSRGATPGQDVLYSATWDFNDQPTVPAMFHVSKDDTVNIRCWYDNPDSFDVSYGEKTENEMCSFVFYYTPFDSLDGCVKTPP